MKNDFKKSDFWKVKNAYGKDKYYLNVQGKWVQVLEEIYAVYKNSYQKMYRDELKEKDLIILYADVDDIYSNVLNKGKYDASDVMYQKELKIKLIKALKRLSKEEFNIISFLYFTDGTERTLAAKMNISKTAVHHKKIKILKKLRGFLDQELI